MKIGIRFSRVGGTRFISHLDMQRTFSRALRRSGLPVKKSEGFNPHIVMSFAAALSVGMETVGDYIEFATTEPVAIESLSSIFDECLPREIRALKIGEILEGSKHLMAAVAESEVEYIPLSLEDSENFKRGFARILAAEEYVIEKKGKKGYKKVFKSVNIRPFIHNAEVGETIVVRLALTNDEALNPFVLLKEIEKCAGTAIRTKVIRKDLFAEDGNSLSDMLISKS